MKKTIYTTIFFIGFLFNFLCAQPIAALTEKLLLNDSIISSAHLGISIYETESSKYLYNYNADKFFIPASTAKLFTLYSGMKYLSDSLVGLYYNIHNDTVFILPSGDPTLLHPNFTLHPVIDFLKKVHYPIVFIDNKNEVTPYARGWIIDDEKESYMPERNVFPIFGNLLAIIWEKKKHFKEGDFNYDSVSANTQLPYFSLTKKTNESISENYYNRIPATNHFEMTVNNKSNRFTQEIPFETFGFNTTLFILQQQLKKPIIVQQKNNLNVKDFIPIFSQPSDSLFRTTMHQSDNFFAEQILLMSSNNVLGFMNEEKIIDKLLNDDFKDMPQKARWVDGSGLSRYNLFTPQDFIYLLNKMQTEFGVDKLKSILPTGGEGTLKNYYLNDCNYLFAKTGSMSNNIALSGIMTTQNNKHLIFSVMLNNYQGSSKIVRKLIENYLHNLRINY